MNAGVFSLYLLFVIMPALLFILWLNERNKKKSEERLRRIIRDELEREKRDNSETKVD